MSTRSIQLRTAQLLNRVVRSASDMWDAENDPFQVFEVEHESCLDLTIEVRNGENITKGFYKDLIDIPDPYVVLRVPGSSNSSKRTSHVDNNTNPIWNETFHFFLDPKKTFKLQATLMDANTFQDEDLGTDEWDISQLIFNFPSDVTFNFEGGSKVNTTITIQKNANPDLRFSLSLCEDEKTFLRERRHKVLQKMQTLLGDAGPKQKEEVPIIAVLGSGGGFRAMICLSAATKALHETGLLDCSTYLAGLSGSSWFISTLYAHEFPFVSLDQINQELKASVTSNWKWNLMHCHQYIMAMLDKSRRGQPVSFTDIFGHLLGDVLLKNQKHKTLSQQRKMVSGGRMPLPLCTCLHAKASVSCKSFSEWIEFTPFEIGIAKYGTFMKAESFGSKFLVGKMIKQFPEFPLHYLQGVWGSAFTILMKRLAFDGGSKQDIVQMMREVNEERAINEKLEKENIAEEEENEVDTDDEADVEGVDDKSEEEDETQGEKKPLTLQEEKERLREILGTDYYEPEPEQDQKALKPLEMEEMKVQEPWSEKKAKTEEEKDSNHSTKPIKGKKEGWKLSKVKGLSFELPKTSKPKVERIKSHEESPSPKCCPDHTSAMLKRERLQRKGAVKQNTGIASMPGPSGYWSSRRQRRRTQKARKVSIFQNLLTNSEVLNSRAGRAGEILNPFRGLSLKNSFPLCPFTLSKSDDEVDDDMMIGPNCRYEPLDNTAKRLFIVDSGLAFNSPYPLLLRPQRAVDMYLSFDFSQRPSDKHMPFKELLLAEKWAKQNHAPFPPIESQVAQYSQEPRLRELYIFKDQEDPFCPVVLHFTIVNNHFRYFKAPGVPRTTEEEKKFAKFSLFDEPNQPYASTNFVYDPLQYERLFKLVEFNTLLNVDTIKEEITKVVQKKREMSRQIPKDTFTKLQSVVNACRRFQNRGNLSLKINEKQRQHFIKACRSLSRQSDDYQDAMDNLDEDSQSDYEDGNEEFDNKDTVTQKVDEISIAHEEEDTKVQNSCTKSFSDVAKSVTQVQKDSSEEKKNDKQNALPDKEKSFKMIETITADL